MNTIDLYRKAAIALWNVSSQETETYIVDPKDDQGEWAPDAIAIIYLEPHCYHEDDFGELPNLLGYFAPGGMENCSRLDAAVDADCYIQYINAAVAAVLPSS